MRKPSEAIADILDRIQPAGERESVALAAAAGRVLADEIFSDIDLPPFEKSAMDGYAVHSADFEGLEGPAELECLGESRAGVPFEGQVPRGSCTEIYTGAELSSGCDAVVMIEKSERTGNRVRLDDRPTPNQHVSHRGEILKVGAAVMSPGRRLSSSDLSVLAAVGCDPVPVFTRPKITILTTGDELVPASETPGIGQIREGNTLYLGAACRAVGCEVLAAEIVPDSESVLLERFGKALEDSTAVITTGGVSMGKYDLVGAVFEKLGVEPILHKVAIKPGKPIWFGMHGKTPVFGLPGNPVSSLLGFQVFVRPALALLGGAGEKEQRERLRRGIWTGSTVRGQWRQQNLPAIVEQGSDGADHLKPVSWLGSADMVGASLATALAVIPADTDIENGESIHYRPLD
ncbi:MAG: molybdopterin molybdotransferase [Planctomycetota bacterium]|jgi:molybdopterin molybdotransferase